ncbi:MAG: XTP/dITP diphosphatase [Clostridiales bacterium]|jgi:XTP/dITP diphosphohydrolase|nr:XTP/dITP diphosphatase [Clostridiales bacterium]
MDIVFATANEGKLVEIKSVLAEFNILSLKDLKTGIEIIEDGATFEENAVKKAQTISRLLNIPVLADDSGLEIDYLDKAPGVYSARYMGEDTSYSVKNSRILNLMKDVPTRQRTARFVCVIAYAKPGSETVTVRAEVEGIIHSRIQGENGFGYDPIFFIPQLNKTTAELSLAEKNEISHRGKALKLMKELLNNEIP